MRSEFSRQCNRAPVSELGDLAKEQNNAIEETRTSKAEPAKRIRNSESLRTRRGAPPSG